MKILIIDDDKNNILNIKNILNEVFDDVHIYDSRNGQEGLRIAEEEQPDVILLDIVMPQIDGFEVCRTLKSNPTTVGIPVIFITGLQSDVDTREKAHDAGAEGFLCKPYDIVELTAQIKTMYKLKLASAKRLQESEDVFKKVFELSPGALSIIRLSDDILLDANKAFFEVFGFSKEEAIGKTTSVLNLWDDENDRSTVLKNLGDGKPIFNKECSFKRKDGSVFNGLISSQHLTFNGAHCIISGIIDITERIEAEKRIQEGEIRLMNMFETSPDGISILDAHGNLVFVSDNLVNWHGYDSPEELIGKSAFDFITSAHREKAIGLFKELLLGNNYGATELELLRKDGSTFFVEANAECNKNQGGEVDSIFLIERDITERKKAELQLAESEQKFRILFETMKQGVFYQSADMELLDINPAGLKMFGLTKDQLFGRTPFSPEWKIVDVHYKEVPADQHPSVVALKEGVVVKKLLGVFNPKLNDYKWIMLVATPQFKNGEAKPYQVYVTMNDITELKKTNEELSRRESLLNKIFDLLPVGLWFADENGKLLRGNPAGVKIWGAEPKVGIDKYGVFKARRLPSGEALKDDDWALYHTVKNGSTVVDELLEIETFDGKKRIILNSTAPVLDNAGKIIAAIVVNNDITEIKLAENELKRKMNELERFNDLMAGRELTMIELKKEINELCQKMGIKERYKIVETD